MAHRRERKDKKKIIDEERKNIRRKILEEKRKLFQCENSDLPDKIMLKVTEAEKEFVRKIIEAVFTDMDSVYDIEALSPVIARLWNTSLLGIVGKMEMIFNAIDEFCINARANNKELETKKLAMTKDDIMEFIDGILNDISSFDRV